MAEPNDSSLAFFTKASAQQWSYVLSLYKDVLRVKAEQRASKKGGPEELIKLDTWYVFGRRAHPSLAVADHRSLR